MSQTELQRFSSAIQADPTLAASYGAATSPEHIASMMRADGYDVSDAEMRALQDAGGELPDEALDQVAGGFVFLLPLIPAVGALIAAGCLIGGTAAAIVEAQKK